MYFIIKSLDDNDTMFSYLLCKKPSAIFDRDKVIGKYINTNEYQIVSNIDSRTMLKTLKEQNLESYVSYQYEGVTPYHLNNIFSCLRSAINKTYQLENEIQSASSVRNLECIIGPFMVDKEKFISVFEKFSLSCEVYEEKQIASSFKISSKDHTLSIFLQKIFILSLYFTFKYTLFPIDKNQIEKYIKLSKEWFENNEYSKSIIRTLSKNNKDYESKFIENIIEDEEAQEALEESLYINHTSLHSIRHNFIGDFFKETELDNITIIDYGCSEGKLSLKINDILKARNKKFTIYAYDINDRAYKRLSKVKNIKFYQMNLLYPNTKILPRKVDFLLLSEIIEHFDERERKVIYDTIINELNPTYVILTTPNKEYNTVLGMQENEKREAGHKIEFTPEQYEKEILQIFHTNHYESVDFAITEEKTIDTDVMNLYGPSFMTLFINRQATRDYKNTLGDWYSPYYLPISNYELKGKEFANGYSSRSFIENSNIFYMAPTVPPVEYNDTFANYLEHPYSAFKYYKDRGIYNIVAENKYMGSRAHIAIFKNEQAMRLFNSDSPIIINTRNGNTFFENTNTLMGFYNAVKDNLKYDITLLDCEMMPWSIKGQGLIDYKFLGVGEASLLNRNYNDFLSKENAEKFLTYLDPYIKKEEPYCRVFGILALGKINGKNIDWKLGTTLDNISKHSYINEFCDNIKFKPTEFSYLDLSCFSYDDEKEYEYWENYTKNGGEGRVYKPLIPRMYAENGYMIQPMLKVRGSQYLHIIYGQDYLEKENFDIVKNRSIKMKRLCAIQETELSDIMLKSYLNRKFDITKKLVAGFIGMNNVSFSSIDKTL